MLKYTIYSLEDIENGKLFSCTSEQLTEQELTLN